MGAPDSVAGKVGYVGHQLRELGEDLDALLSILPVGVWVGNADCSEIRGNPAAYRIMGFPPGINVSLTAPKPEIAAGLRIFIDGQEVRPEDAPMQRVARTGQGLHNFEHEVHFPDGRKAAIYGSVAPLFDERGRVRKVIAAYADYTERKRAEARADSERRLLQAVLASIDDGFTVQDASGKLVFANASAARLIGFCSPEAMIAAPSAETMPKLAMFAADRTPLAPDKLPGRALLAGSPAEPVVVQYQVTGSGERRWSHVRAYPVTDREGRLANVINVFRDVTDEQWETARRRFLLAAVERFNASLDYDATLRTIAHEMVPVLADWCAVDIMQGDELRRLAVEHIDPDKVALVHEIERRYPPSPWAPGSPRTVIRSGKPFLLPVVSPEMIVASARDAHHRELIERLRLRSFLVVPMIGRSGPVGALTLATAESQRTYSEVDVGFVQALADRAAVALENARLVRALESTVASEKRARGWMERTQAVIAAMARGQTPADVAAAVCRMGGPALGASAVHLWLAGGDGSLSLTASWAASGDSSLIDLFRTIAADADVPSARVLRTGQAEWIENEADFAQAAPAIYATTKAAGRMAAFAVLPIPGRQGPLGALSIVHALPHVYDADERAFYQSLTYFCAQSVDRAKLFEEEKVARQRAEQAVNLSELLMGMVSHDLRNPLGAIAMSVRTLLATASTDQKRPASRILTSTQRMTRLIDQLLDFTRIRTGHGLAIAPTAMNLAELARQMVEETEAAHECRITLDCAGDTAGTWDKDRLAQVLANLLANAALHGKRADAIAMRVDGSTPTRIAISISNEGEVPDAILHKIFDPFQGSHTSGRHGLGLGLFITREIVHAHGGAIRVASTAGRTAFEVELPRTWVVDPAPPQTS